MSQPPTVHGQPSVPVSVTESNPAYYVRTPSYATNVASGDDMAYMSPTPRSGDTPLGLIMGDLESVAEYIRWDELYLASNAFDQIPFAGSTLKNIFHSLIQAVYDFLYQGAYNHGADQGNKMNSQILGWIDDLRTEAMNDIQAIQNLDQTFDNWLNNHETRIKALEQKLGLVNQFTPNIPTGLSQITAKPNFPTSLSKVKQT